MSTIDQAVAAAGTALTDFITEHIGGESVPVDAGAKHLGVYFPGTGEQVASLQEDGASTVATAVNTARESFSRGEWSRASTATRQTVFRSAAKLIRDHADELAVLECICAGLPSSHLASRQVPRAADNLDFFADYIGVLFFTTNWASGELPNILYPP